MASTGERGYGAQHRALREQWARRIKAEGFVLCARGCGRAITPTDKWDLGHSDDRKTWTGPECIKCNRGAGGRNGAAKTNAWRLMTIRDWPA